MRSLILAFLFSLSITIIRSQIKHEQSPFLNTYASLRLELELKNPSFFSSLIKVELTDSVALWKKIIAEYKNIVLKWGKFNPVNKDNEEDLNKAVFHFLKDTTKFLVNKQIVSSPPFTYNHADPSGKVDWTNTFVKKLIATHIGNCKSLSYLYKILADELGAKCWLALAPGHIYIKNYSQEIGWYNTELTSGTFPNNGLIMASGYITLDAIKSGMYMDTLSNRQAVAGLAVDLALGYMRKTGVQADSFILKCCDLTLQYHAVNPNALLLKTETMKRMYLDMQDTTSVIARQWFAQMEEIYVRLYKLGYRQMPERMYKQWLQSINNNRKKYTNPRVSKTVN